MWLRVALTFTDLRHSHPGLDPDAYRARPGIRLERASGRWALRMAGGTASL